MLHENLRTLRKTKGFSQEELALRLNVVRQTISKWEKGLSVPDAEMLIRLAEILEVPVSGLLGTPSAGSGEEETPAADAGHIAETLSRINEQLALRNRRAKRIWKALAIIAAAYIAIMALMTVLFSARTSSYEVLDAEMTVMEAEP